MSDTALGVLAWVAYAVFGLVLGSFLTVVVYRVPRKESIVRPRSRCPGCGTQIRTADNIPVISWALRRGRCRSCGESISMRYPLTELATAALWVAAAAEFGILTWTSLVFALFFTFLLAVSLIDVEHRIIPNKLTYPAVPVFAVLVAVGVLMGEDLDLVGALIGLLTYAGGLLVVAFVYPKGMGMGDVKLAAVIGLVLGALGPLRYVLPAAMFAFLLGAVGGMLAIAVGKKGRKSAIPFGPFMAAGAVLAVFLGPPIMDWYLQILGG